MITSFRNPLVKRIKRLRQKKYRQREGAFFVEGIRPVLSAIEYQASIETLVYAPDLLTSQAGRDAVAHYEAQGGQAVALSGPVFGAISDREHPVGLGAVVQPDYRSLAQMEPLLTFDAILVALVDISDPGNLGTILRTVDAAGAQGVILVGDTVDPFHPTAVKASMGTIFSLPIATAQAMADVWPWATMNGLATLAGSAHGTRNYRDRDNYRYPLLLIMGNEGAGLPASVLSRADSLVQIPMSGAASSLNLAVATALLLYEAAFNRPPPAN